MVDQVNLCLRLVRCNSQEEKMVPRASPLALRLTFHGTVLPPSNDKSRMDLVRPCSRLQQGTIA